MHDGDNTRSDDASQTTEEKAQGLAALFLDTVHDLLLNGRVIENKEGEAQRVPLDAASLNVIRQFCKDQNLGVKADPSAVSAAAAKKLADVLPFKFPFPVISKPSTEL